MDIVGLVLIVLAVYLAIGVAFALPFAVSWVARVDPAARGAGWGFRVLIVPASAALWPLLLWRLIGDRLIGDRQSGERQSGERQTGDRAASHGPTGDAA